MLDEDRLSEVIAEDVNLRYVEPGIYSVYPPGDMPGAYDKFGAATLYDTIACNRAYNWLMWGYSVKEYPACCREIMASSQQGWVLDIAWDALMLPFKAKSFAHIICLNLLHCLADIGTVLKELKRVLTPAGASVLTTLVQTGRWSDRYLNMQAASGALVSRNPDELLSAFDGNGLQVAHRLKGNLAFIMQKQKAGW